jgi:hypothetical protein
MKKLRTAAGFNRMIASNLERSDPQTSNSEIFRLKPQAIQPT